jgi:hypothetical protein
MRLQDKIFIDGSRDPLSAVGGRPVRVINMTSLNKAIAVRDALTDRVDALAHSGNLPTSGDRIVDG